MRQNSRKHRCLIAVPAALMALCAAVVCSLTPPIDLDRDFSRPASPVVTDCDGGIMLARIAPDEQLRFPITLREMSPWLIQATIAAEDQRFAAHPGVDPIAVVRACGQDLAARRVVSGASTLTMQLCRLIEPAPRTWTAKLAQAL